MKRLARLLRLAAAGLVLTVTSAPALGVPLPDVPKAKGDHCVEDPKVMRRNHMNYLLHQRDETMHEGIRGSKYSLKNCLECHAPVDEGGKKASHEESGHFCKNCHEYAGVKIDCFECHATKPQSTPFHPAVTPASKPLKEATANSSEVLNQAAGANSQEAPKQ